MDDLDHQANIRLLKSRIFAGEDPIFILAGFYKDAKRDPKLAMWEDDRILSREEMAERLIEAQREVEAELRAFDIDLERQRTLPLIVRRLDAMTVKAMADGDVKGAVLAMSKTLEVFGLLGRTKTIIQRNTLNIKNGNTGTMTGREIIEYAAREGVSLDPDVLKQLRDNGEDVRPAMVMISEEQADAMALREGELVRNPA